MYVIHHYLQRGHKLDDLINLDTPSKLFLQSSMILHFEEEAAAARRRGGDGNV